MAVVAAAIGRRLSTVPRQPAYRQFQVRPHYGQARQKDITLGDVLDAVNRGARTTKLCDAANTIKDLERRVTKLESLVAVGGIVLSGILALSITQPGAMNKLETDQSGLDTRLLIVEDALDISPLPIARSASRPTR